MPVQIQVRRGTSAEWVVSNPILAVGEMGYETDTKQFKIGDGTSPYNSLLYSGIRGPEGEGLNVFFLYGR